jgi:hypothetical protein
VTVGAPYGILHGAQLHPGAARCLPRPCRQPGRRSSSLHTTAAPLRGGVQCGRAGLDPMAVCVWDGGQDRVRHESCLACCAVCWKPAARKGCEDYRGNDVWLRSLSARRVIAAWVYEGFCAAEARSPGFQPAFTCGRQQRPLCAECLVLVDCGRSGRQQILWQECYIKVCTMPPCNVSHNQFHLLS